MSIARKILTKYYWPIKQFFVDGAPDVFVKVYYRIFRRKAEKLYSNILQKYGDYVKIVVCPYAGTGDVYLASACMDEYLKQKKVDDYVFVVIGNSNVKVAKLFQLENIIKFSQYEMDQLMLFLSFRGIDEERVLIAHPDPPCLYTGMMDMMRNFNELNFTDIFTKGVFGIDNNKLEKPTFTAISKISEKLIKKYDLPKGKTVLLAPYSYTLAGIPEWVWRKLVKTMTEHGYTVCTNCGSDSEKEIEGSHRVFLPYSELGYFLEYAGNFVGIRSGFCDIISSIDCKKIIIYQPYLFWGPAGNIDYFSLKNMGLDDSAIEIEYEGIEFLKLIDDIVEHLKINS